jgi:tetratricopeptide (TPR) repeat protein
MVALAVALLAAAVFATTWLAPNAISKLRGASQPGSKVEVALVDQAERALARGDTRSAAALSHNAVARDVSDASIDYRAGNVAWRSGDRSAAEKFYQYGESANNRYPWNFVALSQLYAQEGKLARADAQLRAALMAAPKLQFLHYELGAVELREGLYAAALADFQAELGKSPGYKPAIAGRTAALQALHSSQARSGALGAQTRQPQRAQNPGRATHANPVQPTDTSQKVIVQAFPLPLGIAQKQPPQIVAIAESSRSDRSITAKAAPQDTSASPDAVSERPPWASAVHPAVKAGMAPSAALTPAPLESPSGAPVPPLGAAAQARHAAGVIPNVIGLTVEQATAQLIQAGFQVEHVTLLKAASSRHKQLSRVVNTEPEPGATTPPGSPAVNLIAEP